MHSQALYKWEEILSQQLLPKPLTTLLLSKSSFWCFKLISFCSVCLGNGCRFLPGAPAAQIEEGQGSRVSPAPILRNPSRPQPAQLPRAWPQRSQGDRIFRPIYFQLWSLFRPVWQEPSQHLHESSVPVAYCAGRGGCGGGQGPDLRGCWIIYYLWRHGLIWVFAQALGKWLHPPFSP